VAIKFRGWGAELNFPVGDYTGDTGFRQMLAEMSKAGFGI
jgi:hypothetical protein